MKIGEAIQQGEVYIKRIAERPTGESTPVKIGEKGYILSHSESGHHHILDGGEVLERPQKNAAMQMFYAILDKPQKLTQDAANPHGDHDLEPGFYDIRISREYNPFLQEARRVAD